MVDLPLTKLAETTSTVTLGWTPIPCLGYVLYADGVRKSNSWDPLKSSWKTNKATEIKVVALGAAATGVWPAVVPPPGAFMSYPVSQAISLSGVAGRTIEKLSFSLTPSGRSAIVLTDCHDIIIRNCDFRDVPGCVYAVNCTNIVIEDCRYENITGPAQPRTGANVANFVQFNNVAGGQILRNKGRFGDTEDIVSVFASDHIDVDDNWFEGGTWTSGSGSGISLCDQGGSFNRARRNKLLNVGQVGAFIAGGVSSEISDNIIYGATMPKSNVGVYVWAQGGGACSGHTVSGNQVSFRNAAGVSNPWWDGGNCGSIVMPGNNWNASIDPASLKVVL